MRFFFCVLTTVVCSVLVLGQEGPLNDSSPPAPSPGNGTLPPPPGNGTNPPPGNGTNPPPGNGTNPPPGNGTNPPPGNGTNPPPGNGTNPPPTNGTNPPPGNGTNPPPGNGTRPPPPPSNSSRVDSEPPRQGFFSLLAAFFDREGAQRQPSNAGFRRPEPFFGRFQQNQGNQQGRFGPFQRRPFLFGK